MKKRIIMVLWLLSWFILYAVSLISLAIAISIHNFLLLIVAITSVLITIRCFKYWL